jgi:acetolactate synthase-1/2/3 large subunit
MRFDDRVTGNLKTYARTAKKIHVDIDRAEINKNVRVDVGIAKDLREALDEWLPLVKPGDSQRLARAHRRAQGRLGGPRHPEPPGRRASVCGARHQRHLAASPRARRSSSPTSASIRCGKRSTTSTTARVADHVGRPRHDGLRAAGGDRREDRVPRREVWVVVGDGGFQMTMPSCDRSMQEQLDDQRRIINNGYPRMVRQWQEFFYEQAATRDADHADFAKLAERSASRRPRDAGTMGARSNGRAPQRAALIDFQVEQEDSVYPMVPAGAICTR